MKGQSATSPSLPAAHALPAVTGSEIELCEDVYGGQVDTTGIEPAPLLVANDRRLVDDGHAQHASEVAHPAPSHLGGIAICTWCRRSYTPVPCRRSGDTVTVHMEAE